MSLVNEVLAANASYVADFGAKADLAMPPARGVAILTSMDARLDPAQSAEANCIDWLTIGEQAQSVLEDVQRIRNHPLVPGRIPIYGYIFDVATGALHEVTAARAAGAAA